MKPTQYRDINEILQLLKEGLVSILDKDLIGLYLTGSLAYGGFDDGSSDIDFLVVLRQVLSKEQRQKVEELHSSIGVKYPEWYKRIEGSYITKEMLSKTSPPKQSRLYVNAGKMWDVVYGNEWILDLYVLQECGVTLVGADIKKLIKPIDIDDVREASQRDLMEGWLPKLENPKPFTTEDYGSSHLQAYAVMTMCRILYRAKNRDVVSKRVASAWTKKTYGKPWSNLIGEAERWKHGSELNLEKEIIDFVKFTVNEVGVE